MLKNPLFLLHKIFESAGITTLLYIVFALFRPLLFETCNGSREFLIMLFYSVLGPLFGELSVKLGRGKWSTRRKLVTFFWVPLVFATAAYFPLGTGRAVFEALVAAAVFMAGMVNYDKKLNSGAVFKTVVVSVMATIFTNQYMWLFGGQLFPLYLYIYCSAAIAIVLLNQDRLGRVFMQQNRELLGSALPIQVYNLLIISLVLAAATFLSGYRSLKRVLEDIWIALQRRFAQAIIWFVGFLARVTGGRGKLPQLKGEASQGQLPEQGGWMTLANIFLFMAAALAAVLLFLFIYRWVSRLLKYLAALLAVKGAEGGAAEFTDEIERKVPERVKTARVKTRPGRRSLKYLDGIRNPAEKVRYMYALALEALVKMGVPLRSSDTIWEIKRKSMAACGINMDDLNRVYEPVRYGEKPPVLNELSRAYSVCMDILRRGHDMSGRK